MVVGLVLTGVVPSAKGLGKAKACSLASVNVELAQGD